MKAESRLSLEMVADDKLENDEAKAGAGGEAGVHEPEGGGRHRLVEAANPADEAIGAEEGQVIEADNGGVDRFGRVLGEEREADRQEVGEADAVDDMECDRPKQSNLVARALGRGGSEKAKHPANGETGTDDELGHFIGFAPALPIPAVKNCDEGQETDADDGVQSDKPGGG